MKYLLDVNVLVACVETHEFHGRVSRWTNSLAGSDDPRILTSAVTELGFLRVLIQTPGIQLYAGPRKVVSGASEIERAEVLRIRGR